MRKNWFNFMMCCTAAIAFALAGCQSQPPGVPPEPGGHALGYQDTPPPSRVPPTNVPPGTPVGQDGQQMYVEPSNPMPPGGLPADAPPTTQPEVVRPNDVSR